MTKPCREHTTYRITAHIPKSQHDAIQNYLRDPVRGKPLYGSLSRLIENLLESFLNSQGRSSNGTN